MEEYELRWQQSGGEWCLIYRDRSIAVVKAASTGGYTWWLPSLGLSGVQHAHTLEEAARAAEKMAMEVDP